MDTTSFINFFEMMTSSHNRFYLLRHGNSQANQKQIIVSDEENGIGGYGLSEQGKKDIKTTIEKAKGQFEPASPCVIYSSPFKRARESAEITAGLLGVQEIHCDLRLKERFFGTFNLSSDSHYETVWQEDVKNTLPAQWDVESVQEVFARLTALVVDIERQYAQTNIILVTHGDPAQILECGFKKMDPQNHRRLESIAQGELRRVL